jgi:hypothetical protein
MNKLQAPKKEEIKHANPKDRIEGNCIFLDGWGIFPKRVIIVEPGQTREYVLQRTSLGNYYLLK